MKKDIKNALEDKKKIKKKDNIRWSITLMIVAAVISVI